MWPAMAERVRAMLDSPAGKIRGPEKLDADMRQADRSGGAAAGDRQAEEAAQAAGDRHSDVLGPLDDSARQLHARADGQVYRRLRADLQQRLELLKYPKIKEFDAIYLNNVCGMVHNDPEVREGILRFVREGGGIGGHHAVTFANNNWPEFAEMMGGWAGAHHTEKQVIKIDDPNSPLTKSVRHGELRAHRRVLPVPDRTRPTRARSSTCC